MTHKSYIRAVASSMKRLSGRSFLDFQLQVDSFEDQVKDLIDNMDSTSDKVEELNFDFTNLLRDLKDVKHSDDDYHVGESILDHMKEVLRNVNDLTDGWDSKKRNMMRLVAFLHDVAKPETFEMRDNKATFYGHPDRGYEVVKKLLDQFNEESEELREYVAKLVKYHHRLYELAHAKKNLKDPNQVSYLKNFMDSGMATEETLKDLATFAQADSMTPTALKEVQESVKIITEDIKKYKEQQAEKERLQIEKEKRKAERLKNTDKIETILIEKSSLSDKDLSKAMSLLPDLSAFNKYLGQAKKEYGAIKAIQKYLNSK